MLRNILFSYAFVASLFVMGPAMSTFAFPFGEFGPARSPYIDGHLVQYTDLIKAIQAYKQLYGKVTTDVANVYSPQGTKANIVWCENALVVRHGSGKYHRQVFDVRGGILEAYRQAGGIGGKLGLPIHGGYVYNSQGHHAQDFEGGKIYWSKPLNKFVVAYK